jgi:hypothetical protein
MTPTEFLSDPVLTLEHYEKRLENLETLFKTPKSEGHKSYLRKNIYKTKKVIKSIINDNNNNE